MSNRMEKPKMSAKQLISKMKSEKGITFKYISEENAEHYLANVNNYLRTASYRKNYQKYTNGANKGKYINLDFQYLKELSTIDMHLRFLISRMCCDIEHDLKVRILEEIVSNDNESGYDIVKIFLDANPYVCRQLELVSVSPFTEDLIEKYFKIEQHYNEEKGRNENHIISYDDCPAWVFVELLSFGDFMRFYKFFYETVKGKTKYKAINTSIINLVRGLRNACAHNNCILANLKKGNSYRPKEIGIAVSAIPEINARQRNNRLSNRPMLEFVATLYLYREVVSPNVKASRLVELKELFFVRMPRNKEYFVDNQLITTNYEFACKVIKGFFG